jgi:hypothetical protein
MKKITFLLILSTLILASCGSSNSNSNQNNSSEEVQNNTKDKSIAKNCNEFLDEYEKWTDQSLELLEAYIKNPMDVELANKYMKLATEGMDWATRWSSYYGCAAKEKYNKRFEEIAEKTEKKMKELGLD